MKTCHVCGDAILSGEDLVCFRCKQSGVRFNLEIYDKDDYVKEDPNQSLTDAYLGNINYRRMRRGNIEYGNRHSAGNPYDD